jgi:hypothetical protein
MFGVVKLFVPMPPFNGVPPVATSYQSISIPLDEALRFTVPGPQCEFGVTVGLTGAEVTFADLVTLAL